MNYKTNLYLFLFILTILSVLFLALLLKASPDGEYSSLTFSATPGLYPKSSLVKYSYLPSSLDDNAIF